VGNHHVVAALDGFYLVGVSDREVNPIAYTLGGGQALGGVDESTRQIGGVDFAGELGTGRDGTGHDSGAASDLDDPFDSGEVE
jgi:hypothetical protein